MDYPTTVKILKFHAERCKGCLECEKACSQVHFKTKDGGEKSAIRIIKQEKGYKMHVCDQRGLCLDMCPVGALTRRKNGVVWLDKDICIGCQACVGFCPIGAMRKSEKALELAEIQIATIRQVVYHNLGV
jgi:carbon-monoxide dehydrogenase iron sulfur subunit